MTLTSAHRRTSLTSSQPSHWTLMPPCWYCICSRSSNHPAWIDRSRLGYLRIPINPCLPMVPQISWGRKVGRMMISSYFLLMVGGTILFIVSCVQQVSDQGCR
ncbi:hypothetical protein BJX99DRAFT_231710 [Aspergillus californicus]